MEMVRTTIDLPRELFTQLKMMALLTGKPMAYLVRVAVSEKLKELKGKAKDR